MARTLGELAAIARGQWRGSCECERPLAGVSTDTRQLCAGDVFLAIDGDRFDGHRFVADAFAGGAVAALVRYDRVDDLTAGDGPCLVVDDPLRAMARIARDHRRSFTGPVVGVTGSAGKTTAGRCGSS